MGCSSLTSAQEFKDVVKGMNPKAQELVLDNDPLSIALVQNLDAKNAQIDVLDGDVEKLGQFDLVATNFLITSLPEEERMAAYRKLFAKWKSHIYERTGRMVLVEQLDNDQLKEVFSIAEELGYQLSGDNNPKTEWGINRKAVRYKSHSDAEYFIENLPQGLKSERIYEGGYYSDEVNGVVVRSVSVLVFVLIGETGPYVNDVLN